MKTLIKPFFGLALLGLSTTTLANGYVGATIGQTDIGVDTYDNATSFEFTAGYQFSPFIALEASYLNLGESEDDIYPIWQFETQGLNLGARLSVPLGEAAEIFAKVGGFAWQATLREEGYGEFYDDDGLDLIYGGGLLLNLTPELGITLEYKGLELEENQVNNVSVGATLRF